MLKVFISYSRDCEIAVKALVEDVEALGHSAWFDQDTSGGQAWWDQVLSEIRECDVFLFGLAPRSLNSVACKREYRYADDLGKPIIPVLVVDGVSVNLLPSALSVIQFVDYQNSDDRDAAFRLARAFNAVPPLKPLPDPLPDPPKVPVSYLGGLTDKISATSISLSFEEQTVLVADLKRSLRDPETAEDGITLLKSLRKRRDLLATTAADIDELLAHRSDQSLYPPQTSNSPKPESEADAVETHRPAEDEPQRQAKEETIDRAAHKPTPKERKNGAIIGAIIFTVFGMIIMVSEISRHGFVIILWAFLPGIGGGIAGAITGLSRSAILTVIVTSIIGWMLVSLAIPWGGDAFAAGAAYGVPVGAIAGAIIRVLFRKKFGRK